MLGSVKKSWAILFLGAGLTGCANPQLSAQSISPVVTLTDSTSNSAVVVPTLPMREGDVASVPGGYISFCLRMPDQCRTPPGAPLKVAMTDAVWQELADVNSQVNAAIWPEDDLRHYGRAEYWNIPTDGYGDCEDYALTKRKALIDAGLSEAALRIALVFTPDQERHAVLTVATDKGDFVLDNLTDNIVGWQSAGYTWIERQDPTRDLGWVSLGPQPQLLAEQQTAVTGALR